MKKLNKKGFTLIELLAVIIILGVLLLIAVPSVSKYITDSRMKTYRNNLSNFVSAVTNEVNAMEINGAYSFKSNEVLVVPFNKIELEKGSNTQSPFGNYDTNYSYVLVTRKYTVNNNGTADDTSDDICVVAGYNYYVQALDDNGYGAKFAKVGESVVDAVSGLVKVPANQDALVESASVGDTGKWVLPEVAASEIPSCATINAVKVIG